MRPLEDIGYRQCFVCGHNIGSAGNKWEHKAQIEAVSAVPIGGRMEAVAHNACLKALQQEYDLYEASQDSQLTSNFAGRQAQIGHGGTMNGEESGVGASHLLNRPCFYCHAQVTRGVIMTVGSFKVAAHPACKAKVTEMIAAALDIDHLAENRQGSVVGMAGR